jgi:hypothetical protein
MMTVNAERAERLSADELVSGQAKAFVLHSRGVPYRQIAKELDVSTGTAWNWVQAAAAAIEFKPSDEAAERARDRATLDHVLETLNVGVQHGEIDLATWSARVMTLVRERTNLLGHAAPRKSAITIEPPRKPVRPDTELMAALHDELARLDEHEREVEDLEANDGLMGP